MTYNFQTRLWIFLIYGMEVVSVVFFEEIILYMPGKFWFGETSFGHITSKRSYEDSYLVWNFFEFWLFPGNQSYCVLFLFYEERYQNYFNWTTGSALNLRAKWPTKWDISWRHIWCESYPIIYNVRSSHLKEMLS